MTEVMTHCFGESVENLKNDGPNSSNQKRGRRVGRNEQEANLFEEYLKKSNLVASRR